MKLSTLIKKNGEWSLRFAPGHDRSEQRNGWNKAGPGVEEVLLCEVVKSYTPAEVEPPPTAVPVTVEEDTTPPGVQHVRRARQMRIQA